MTTQRGATSGASIHTDPDHARRVIEDSRREFDARYPDLELAPVVGLICAYEEEANIGAVLAAMPTEACGLPVTTLVIVDGGSDRTDVVAKESGAVTFVLTENLGHGYALRVGYSLCIDLGASYVVTLDADGQNDPSEIPVMLQPLVDDEADFVVASRVLGQDTTTDSFRKAGVRVFSYVMSAMGRTKLTDTSNGYRALRVSMLDDIAHRLVQAQYQTAELLIIAMRRGWRVTERPTVWLPRASGTTKKGKNWLFGFRYGRVVFGTWWKVRKEPRHP
ncbi:MAG TPA: glycosyltransferase family 2 protein [Acidimicrobiales bacterium]|nr:glycosyltransferase family 2 protein [Acidimicrobiales bacterium]